jgi:hypothetical protein
VLGNVAPSLDPTRQRGRELGIDEETHPRQDSRRTGWSFWRAANSNTAVMSSASR